MIAPTRTPALSPLVRFLAFPLLALAAALVSNRLAPPSRRLAWRSGVPEPGPASPGTPGGEGSAPSPGGVHPVPPATPREGRVPAQPRRRPPAPVTPPLPQAGPGTDAAPASPIRDIEGPEVWAAFQAGIPFLDARRSDEYAEGHIPGAFAAPVWEADVDDRVLQFLARRKPAFADPIVIYCAGGGCQDSRLLARKLMDFGFHHLLIDRDGYPGWIAQGRPVEKGRP